MSSKITQGDPGGREEGVGNISPAMIRERAAEIAVIDGRRDDEVTPGDLRQAEDELRADLDPGRPGRDLPEIRPAPQSGDPTPSRATQSAGPGLEEGYRSPGEQLFQQGIEEAVHDEMLESGKESLREEDEER